MSKDGGPSYPPDYAGTLPASVPATAWAVPVYDVGTCTGRMLALDLDPARGSGPAGPAAQLSAAAVPSARVVTRWAADVLLMPRRASAATLYVLLHRRCLA
jgi:hypothetical protein